MTTDEVCKLGRIEARTFLRRRRSGRYQIDPIDRARQNLFDTRDVLRIFGLLLPEAMPATPVRGEHRPFDREATIAARDDARPKFSKLRK